MVATFSIATSRQWIDKATNEKKSVVEYHNIVAWRKLAEICSQYLRKGRQVYIEGYLQTRSWDDQNGTKRYRTEVVADNMIMLGGNDGTTAPLATPTSGGPMDNSMPSAPEPVGDDVISIEDIPF
jgi:single-strand DNA-binding protein